MSSRGSYRSHASRTLESLPETEDSPSPTNRHPTFWLDEVFRVPGTGFRFGFGPLLSLIPATGDVMATVLGCMAILDAVRLRAPVPVLLQMLWSYAVNWYLGSVSLIGPFFDTLWMSNAKNLKLPHRVIEDRDQVREATTTYWLVALTLVFGATPVLLATPFVLPFWLFGLRLGR